jgi:hypothetical protein
MLEISLSNTRTESGCKAVAKIRVIFTRCSDCQDGTASSAVQRIATPLANRIAGDSPALPQIVHRGVQGQGAVLPNMTDPDRRISGALPASIDVGKSIKNVHPGMSAAKALPEVRESGIRLLEEPASVPFDRVVRSAYDMESRLLVSHPR